MSSRLLSALRFRDLRLFLLHGGDSQRNGDDHGGEQLQVVCRQADGNDDGDDQVVDDGTYDGGGAAHDKTAEAAQQHFADDDAGKADDDGAATHVDIRIALILGEQRAGKGHKSVGEHQAEHLHGVGVDGHGPGHVLIVAGGADGVADLSAEEPVHDRHQRRAEQRADDNGFRPVGSIPAVGVGGREDQRLGEFQQRDIWFTVPEAAAHDVQVDGVKPQLSQNTGQDRRDLQLGVEQTRNAARQHAGAEGQAQRDNGIHVFRDKDRAKAAAGGKAAVHRQIGKVKDFEG